MKKYTLYPSSPTSARGGPWWLPDLEIEDLILLAINLLWLAVMLLCWLRIKASLFLENMREIRFTSQSDLFKIPFFDCDQGRVNQKRRQKPAPTTPGCLELRCEKCLFMEAIKKS